MKRKGSTFTTFFVRKMGPYIRKADCQLCPFYVFHVEFQNMSFCSYWWHLWTHQKYCECPSPPPTRSAASSPTSPPPSPPSPSLTSPMSPFTLHPHFWPENHQIPALTWSSPPCNPYFHLILSPMWPAGYLVFRLACSITLIRISIPLGN